MLYGRNLGTQSFGAPGNDWIAANEGQNQILFNGNPSAIPAPWLQTGFLPLPHVPPTNARSEFHRKSGAISREEGGVEPRALDLLPGIETLLDAIQVREAQNEHRKSTSTDGPEALNVDRKSTSTDGPEALNVDRKSTSTDGPEALNVDWKSTSTDGPEAHSGGRKSTSTDGPEARNGDRKSTSTDGPEVTLDTR